MKANIRSPLAFFSLALQLLLGLMAFMALNTPRFHPMSA